MPGCACASSQAAVVVGARATRTVSPCRTASCVTSRAISAGAPITRVEPIASKTTTDGAVRFDARRARPRDGFERAGRRVGRDTDEAADHEAGTQCAGCVRHGSRHPAPQVRAAALGVGRGATRCVKLAASLMARSPTPAARASAETGAGCRARPRHAPRRQQTQRTLSTQHEASRSVHDRLLTRLHDAGAHFEPGKPPALRAGAGPLTRRVELDRRAARAASDRSIADQQAHRALPLVGMREPQPGRERQRAAARALAHPPDRARPRRSRRRGRSDRRRARRD